MPHIKNAWVIGTLILSQVLCLPAGFQSREKDKPAGSLTEDQRIVHVLNRAGFGPRPGDVERVRRLGVEKYIASQLQPWMIDDAAVESRLSGLKTLTMSTSQLIEQYPPRMKSLTNQEKSRGEVQGKSSNELDDTGRLKTLAGNRPGRIIGELAQAKLLRAVYSERQLQEVMVDFWSNHFNVFAAKGANKWLITAYDRDVIRPHALGKFKDLLEATAKSPAMLFYLDNWMSANPDASLNLNRLRSLRPRRNRFGGLSGLGGRGEPNDRKMDNGGEDPQRRTGRKLGLNENYARELMELHTLGVDGGYTQQDIIEVARCLTGWTISRPRQDGEFRFARLLHDDGEKTVLGHKISAGGGIRDGEKVLEILAGHPSTARFIALKLTRRFVSDEPPAALVARVAQVFRKTEGNISSMLQTILRAPEFYSHEAYRAKVKTPFELVASSIRALGGETQGGVPLLRAISQMGEPLYLCQPPTGFPDRAEAWVSTGALVNRLNFGLALAGNQLPGTRVTLESLVSTLDQPSEDLVQALTTRILQGEVSPQTLNTLRNVTVERDAGVASRDLGLGPAKIAGLLLGSPEFQRQ